MQSVAGRCKIARRFGFPYRPILAEGETMIRNLCIAAIRLLALYFGAMAALRLFNTFAYAMFPLSDASPDPILYPNLLIFGAILAISVTLWIFSGSIARVMSPNTDSLFQFDISVQDIVLIGLCLIGAITLINSLPEVIVFTIEIVRSRASEGDGANSSLQLQMHVQPGLVSSLIEAIISSVLGAGLLLFGFRLRPLLRKFQTLRTKGHEKPEPISASETSERS